MTTPSLCPTFSFSPPGSRVAVCPFCVAVFISIARAIGLEKRHGCCGGRLRDIGFFHSYKSAIEPTGAIEALLLRFHHASHRKTLRRIRRRPRWHPSRSIWHMLSYVRPSEPHTGRRIWVQLEGQQGPLWDTAGSNKTGWHGPWLGDFDL